VAVKFWAGKNMLDGFSHKLNVKFKKKKKEWITTLRMGPTERNKSNTSAAHPSASKFIRGVEVSGSCGGDFLRLWTADDGTTLL